jgi:hypothetical protein
MSVRLDDHSGRRSRAPTCIYKVPCPSVCPSVTELGSVTDGRLGPARQNGIPLMSSSAATRRRSRFCRARARDSRSALHACRGLETQVLRAEYRGPETRDPETQCPFIEVLELRSWEPNAATRQQQKKGAASVCLSPETQLSRLLIGLAWLLKLGFLGRYQYIKKRVLGFKFFRFFGGWVWGEGYSGGLGCGSFTFI